MPALKVTADDVRRAIAKKYPAPEYATLYEVLDATGARHTRSADAVIMSCWPSRGLELWGVEIKVSRSDWMHERSKPAKAETIAAYCDRWWLVTGPGVVHSVDEIPPAWGWMELGRPGGSLPLEADGVEKLSLCVRKDAAQTEIKPTDRKFLASLLRSAHAVAAGSMKRMRREARDGVEAEVKRRVEDELKRRTPEKMGRAMAAIDAYREATGVCVYDPETYYFGDKDVEAVRQMGLEFMAMRKFGATSGYPGMAGAYVDLLGVMEAFKKAGDAVGVDLRKLKARR